MTFRSFTALASGAILAVTVTACRGDDAGTYQDPAETRAVGTTGSGAPRVADIKENPAQFIGTNVTVEAEVDRVVGPRAFYLDEEAPLRAGIDNDLLVLTRSAGGTVTADRADAQFGDERVRVTGTVSRFSVVELEREIGWDLSPELEVELEAVEVVLIADSVQRVHR